MLEYNISNTSETHSDASWTLICWDVFPVHHLSGNLGTIYVTQTMIYKSLKRSCSCEKEWCSGGFVQECLQTKWVLIMPADGLASDSVKSSSVIIRCDLGVLFFYKHSQYGEYWSFVRGIHRSPVNSPHKGQSRGALVFSLICGWINGWVNNREASDLRRHYAHYDVTLMYNFDNVKYARFPCVYDRFQ